MTTRRSSLPEEAQRAKHYFSIFSFPFCRFPPPMFVWVLSCRQSAGNFNFCMTVAEAGSWLSCYEERWSLSHDSWNKKGSWHMMTAIRFLFGIKKWFVRSGRCFESSAAPFRIQRHQNPSSGGAVQVIHGCQCSEAPVLVHQTLHTHSTLPRMADLGIIPPLVFQVLQVVIWVTWESFLSFDLPETSTGRSTKCACSLHFTRGV